MNNLKLEDYLKRHPLAMNVASIKKPHEAIRNDNPIVVCYEDIVSNNYKSNFTLFNNGIYVGNAVYFPCSIPYKDRTLIGKEMIDELLESSDFADLDRELNGQAACEEFKDIYKSCDECPELKNEECMGAMYSIPTHKIFWKIEDKWNDKYGENSIEHKKYITSKMIGQINQFMWVCGQDNEYLEEVLIYAKEHTNNKHKKLFK